MQLTESRFSLVICRCSLGDQQATISSLLSHRTRREKGFISSFFSHTGQSWDIHCLISLSWRPSWWHPFPHFCLMEIKLVTSILISVSWRSSWWHPSSFLFHGGQAGDIHPHFSLMEAKLVTSISSFLSHGDQADDIHPHFSLIEAKLVTSILISLSWRPSWWPPSSFLCRHAMLFFLGNLSLNLSLIGSPFFKCKEAAWKWVMLFKGHCNGVNLVHLFKWHRRGAIQWTLQILNV